MYGKENKKGCNDAEIYDVTNTPTVTLEPGTTPEPTVASEDVFAEFGAWFEEMAKDWGRMKHVIWEE